MKPASLAPEMKLFELIDIEPSLLSIFVRLGIRLPFGDVAIDEVCRREGYSVALLMELCRMHLDSDYRPSPDMMTEEMLPQVITYLRASHRYYTHEILPHAAAHLDEILATCDRLVASTLRRFYDDYVHCIEEHLEDEEQHLFAAIDSSTQTSLAQFDNIVVPHADIDDRTNDIASLLVKCLPEATPTALRYSMLRDIYALRDDLRRHSDVELYMLRPMILKFITRK